MSDNNNNKNNNNENNKKARDEPEPDRVLIAGKPNLEQCDNTIITARYTAWSFFPVAILEQFRRFANQYFLVVGMIMFIGTYTPAFQSAMSPWTLLGPLMLVIGISLLVQANADVKRHAQDKRTNSALVTVLRRADELLALEEQEQAKEQDQNQNQNQNDHNNNDKKDKKRKVQRDARVLRGRDVKVNINKTYYNTEATGGGNKSEDRDDDDDSNVVSVAFQRIKRKDIRQGHFCLVKNRETVPADMVLLASSHPGGGAYIETMSIDGETNLKLRTSPHLPAAALDMLRRGSTSRNVVKVSQQQQKQQSLHSVSEEGGGKDEGEDDDDEDEEEAQREDHCEVETIEQAVKRLTRFSYLGRPHAESVLDHPLYNRGGDDDDDDDDASARGSGGGGGLGGLVRGVVQQLSARRNSSLMNMASRRGSAGRDNNTQRQQQQRDGRCYVAALTTEPPNASVHSFSGKLTLPPFQGGDVIHDIPLTADNVLLRGAVVRNTEWILGLVFFTGTDTKLVQNMTETPSKFSQLDVLTNQCVMAILGIMIVIIAALATLAENANRTRFDELWYAGFHRNTEEPWPYLSHLPPPKWTTESDTWIQYFFVYVTLLSQMIPLSLYISLEFCNAAGMYLLSADLDIYDDTTDTRAAARSTILSDLGRVQYIFSDKTGTLTQNVMRFRRCSVDGIVFGQPVNMTTASAAATAKSQTSSNNDKNDHHDDEHDHDDDEEEKESSSYRPLMQLVAPTTNTATHSSSSNNEGNDDDDNNNLPVQQKQPPLLSFNTEMFLRVMSLCHTVVVEEDLSKKDMIEEQADDDATTTPSSILLSGSNQVVSACVTGATNIAKGIFQKINISDSRENNNSGTTSGNGVGVGSGDGDEETVSVVSVTPSAEFTRRSLVATQQQNNHQALEQQQRQAAPGGAATSNMVYQKGPDGAPVGFAYQAESPDEGALVSAASSPYDFQVIARDSSGIRLRTRHASHLQQDSDLVRALRNQSTRSLTQVAANTAHHDNNNNSHDTAADTGRSSPSSSRPAAAISSSGSYREESWAILAVNKFDSDRKRMSVLLRSPKELGGLPILFCKGADSSMLDPNVCASNACSGSGGGDETGEQQEDAANMEAEGGSAISGVAPAAGARPKMNMLGMNPWTEHESEHDDDHHDEENDEGEADNNDDEDAEAWRVGEMLAMHAHLGDFAREGLRTLVLGMRVLSEGECQSWLEKYNAAAAAMKGRKALLADAARAVERNLHVVGATAIEDKLQRAVPDTIATLAKAGIKLWVLTGDKRETAVEIGYSTKVLTPKMRLTQVPDDGERRVRTQLAVEFLRLVKTGRLPQYQKSSVESESSSSTSLLRRTISTTLRYLADFWFALGKFRRRTGRLLAKAAASAAASIGFRAWAQRKRDAVQCSEEQEKQQKQCKRANDTEPRRKVREKAQEIIDEWLQFQDKEQASGSGGAGGAGAGGSLRASERPFVFDRAASARLVLKSLRSISTTGNNGKMNNQSKKILSIARLQSSRDTTGGGSSFVSGGGIIRGGSSGSNNNILAGEVQPQLVDRNLLSQSSFTNGGASRDDAVFDASKRTILERAFAVDRQVRRGLLVKHLREEKRNALRLKKTTTTKKNRSERNNNALATAAAVDGPAALVIEGAALNHLLGDAILEQILFAVASTCDTVVACRVSPRQKALLVKLVRRNVRPSPITLAVGDGANDVGMIQEAHVGVGISGKEGRQAVNASDFSVAQFRFLEELVLLHGRWNFYRLGMVVLFSFYRTSVMAGTLVIYSTQNVYSGTPLFNQMLIATVNFVAGAPIILTGVFDRYIDKEYVRQNPAVYKDTMENEVITPRILVRWVVLVVLQICVLYFCTVPIQSSAGGSHTPAWQGLMWNNPRDAPGDGEGGDLTSVGSVAFTALVFILGYKAMYETRTIIQGVFPWCTCRRADDADGGEGWPSRLPYTWIGLVVASFVLYFAVVYGLQFLGTLMPGSSSWAGLADHFLETRSLSWLLIIFVPLLAAGLDVIGKTFSNLFYPTQTQIHLEIEQQQLQRRRQQRRAQEERAAAYSNNEKVTPPQRQDAGLDRQITEP